MYCVKCNSKIEYHMKKCKKCGRKTAFEDFLFMDKKINPLHAKSEFSESEEQISVNTSQPEENKKLRKGIYIVSVCVLVAVLAVGAFIFLKPKLNKPASPESVAKPTAVTDNKTEENKEKKYFVNGLGGDIVVTDAESARNVVKNIGGLFKWKESDAEKAEIIENTYENNKFYRCLNDGSAIIIAADIKGKVFYISEGESEKIKAETEKKDDNSILSITGLDKNDAIYKAYDVILNGAEHEVKSKLIDLSEQMNESGIDKDKIQNVWEMSMYMISSDFDEEQCMYAVLTASERILGEQYKDAEMRIMKMKADMQCIIVNEECDFKWLSKSQELLLEKNYITTKTDIKGEKVEKFSNNEFYTVKISHKSEKSEKEVYVYVSDIGVSEVVTKTDFDDAEGNVSDKDKDKKQMSEKKDDKSEINEKPDDEKQEKPSDVVKEITNEIL